MNTLTNQSSPTLSVQPLQCVRRSCLNCNYIGETPDIKCPICGNIPLMAVSKLKFDGALKIVWGILPIVIVISALASIYHFSLWKEISLGSAFFRGDTFSFILIFWGFLLAFVGGSCEAIAGIWLIVYAKPNRTIKTLKPVLRLLYVVTGLTFVIVNKIKGYD